MDQQTMEYSLDEKVEVSGWSDEDIIGTVKRWYGYGDDVTLVWAEKMSDNSKAVVLGFPAPTKGGVMPRITLSLAKGSVTHYVWGQKWLFAGPDEACYAAFGQNSTRWINVYVPPQ